MNGNDLIALGYKPGAYFKGALETIDDTMSEAEVREIVDRLVPEPPMEMQSDIGIEIYMQDIDQGALDTMREVVKTPTVRRAMLMPDACPAGPLGTIPVGGVLATENAIHPGMHSADVCCSMMATYYQNRTPKSVLDEVHSNTHFGPGPRTVGRKKMSTKMKLAFEGNPFLSDLVEMGDSFLGTQGDGNHFAFVGISKRGQTVLVTHHGSRKPGAELFKRGMAAASTFGTDTLKQNAWIDMTTQEGQDYWDALHIIADWTRENHACLHPFGGVARIFTPHNFVFEHEGFYWHAKGSTPMFGAQPFKLIPMNMAEPILVVKAKDSLFAPHGAGRDLSRSAHRKSLGDHDPVKVFKRETRGLDIRFYSGKPDVTELPSSYRSAQRVRDDITFFNMANVIDEIQPYGAIMNG